jgi:LmbE family N-acetylglucosaminyl deacetylase
MVDVVFVSPHLDDVALSCAGTVRNHVTRGETALVVTVFAGPLASDERVHEDDASMAVLGAEAVRLSFADAIARVAHPREIWRDVVDLPLESAVTEALAALWDARGRPAVVAPLAVGGHVDHRICHRAARALARRGARVAFYEDYPYAARAGLVEARLAEPDAPRSSRVVAADAAVRIAAVRCYRSQVPILFGSDDRMVVEIERFAAACGGERLWFNPPGGRTTMPEARTPTLFDKKNDKLRIDTIDELDGDADVSLMAFSRRLGALHLYHERFAPMMRSKESMLFTAVTDRTWPPWGLGARTVHAVCQLHQIGDRSFGVSPVLVADHDLTNIGLQAAVYKEVLEHAARIDGGDVNYLVAEGSVLADRVLRGVGFERTKDFVHDEQARYYAYRAEAKVVLAELGLEQVSTPDLLAHAIEDKVFEQNAMFHMTLQITLRPSLFGRIPGIAEIIAIDAGLSGAALPGGVDVPSPSRRIDITGLAERLRRGPR